MKINKVGIELEGMFKVKPTFKGRWKHDASVVIDGRDGEFEGSECDGSCRENCECGDYCECEECRYCSNCDRIINNCVCSGCLICNDCENPINDCSCTILRNIDCENKKCTIDNICNDCIDMFRDNRNTSYDCNSGSNGAYTSCDLGRCGCECQCECDDDCCNSNSNVGEFVSVPLSLSEIDEWISTVYPDKTNSTCGGHIHISLKSCADYMNLMDRSFYEYYLDRMTKWGKKMKINEGSSFWKRLSGAQYCYAKFQPIEQRDMRGHYEDPRYAQINYCYNVDNRHTVEFRMLPCFQKMELMSSGIRETIDIIETYLSGIDPNSNMIVLRIEI